MLVRLATFVVAVCDGVGRRRHRNLLLSYLALELAIVFAASALDTQIMNAGGGITDH